MKVDWSFAESPELVRAVGGSPARSASRDWVRTRERLDVVEALGCDHSQAALLTDAGAPY